MEYPIGFEDRCNVFVFGGLFFERQELIQKLLIESKKIFPDDRCAEQREWKKILNEDTFEHNDVGVHAIPITNAKSQTAICHIWNFSDKKMSQGIAQLFLNHSAIIMFVNNDSDVKDTEKIAQTWRNFAFKGVSHVIIISIGQNTSNYKDTEDRIISTFESLDETILKSIQHRSECERNTASKRMYHRQNSVKGLFSSLESLYQKTHQIPIQHTPTTSQIQQHIVVQRQKNIVFCDKKCLSNIVATENEDTETVLTNLINRGFILKLGCNTNENQSICINQILFLRLIFAIHIDTCNKTFRIVPDRFWPNEVKNRPDPSCLEKVIEDIPNKGLIRQSLFPLLWQDLLCNKEQILTVSKEMEKIGLLIPCKKMSMFSDVLSLYDYPQLSSVDQMSLLLMGKMNDLKPSLNWYEDLQTSDLQLQFIVTFSHGVPVGCLDRFPGVVHVAYKNIINYHYGWKSGLLLRINDVYIYISIRDESFEMFVRTDVDIYTSAKEACKELWLTGGLALYCFNQYMMSWPEIIFQINTSVKGHVYPSNNFHTNSLNTLLSDCYCQPESAINEDIRDDLNQLFVFEDFKVKNDNNLIQDWIEFLKTEMDKSMQSYVQQVKTIPKYDKPKNEEKSCTRKTRKRKDITWDVPQTELENVTSSSAIRMHPEIPNIHPAAATRQNKDKVFGSDNTVTEHQTFKYDAIDKQDFEADNVQRLVKQFIACILASGVATFIEEECERSGKWTSYQATVAMEMAETIMFVNSNDVMLAAKSIIRSVDKAEGRDVVTSNNCCIDDALCSCGNKRPGSKISSVCVLL